MSIRRWVCAGVLWSLAGAAFGESATQPASAPAESAPTSTEPVSFLDRDTLTDNWFGAGRTLQDMGVDIRLGLLQVYQQNLQGGLSTHRHAGRYSGRYDLELDLDLEKLIHLPGGQVYALARGGWSDGIDESSVGSLFGANTIAVGDQSIDLWQLFYEHSFLDGKIRARIGRIDLTNCLECHECKSCFDGNAFANDESCQFLNGSLVNNPTIPFPEPGMGSLLHVELAEWLYVAAAVADADARVNQTGFDSAFHGPANTFSIYEFGLLPSLPSAGGELRGAYRAGLWYDPQEKERFDGDGEKTDDVGAYVSLDQKVFRENSAKDDAQGLGVFGRWGIADDRVNEIKDFWSTGLHYLGLIPGRDADVMGLGVGQGLLSRAAGFTASHETVMEWFYTIEIAPWLHVAPDAQYIFHPGGDASVRDAVVVGGRLHIVF